MRRDPGAGGGTSTVRRCMLGDPALGMAEVDAAGLARTL